MICASCGVDALEPAIRDLTQTYKGRVNIIKKVNALFCDSCDAAELEIEGDESARVSREMEAFIKSVNSGLADAGFIASVRRKLGLTQAQAGEIFGGGHNGFSRYEAGRSVPPVALVALFIILDKRPELLEEIKDSAISRKAAKPTGEERRQDKAA